LYFEQYPEPIAVAISLSSDPARFLASILLTYSSEVPASSVGRLLNRLAVERPRLGGSVELGIGLARAMESYSSAIVDEYERFLGLEGARAAFVEGLSRYSDPEEVGMSVSLRLAAGVIRVGTVEPPRSITLERYAVDALRAWGLWRHS
jgi:hypothetical protein